jgi:type I restriction enzyme, S subunit
MNAERLLAHYEKIADAPDSIARLRRFVLDLAVRGKLVPQEVGDEPASELLRRIAKEKRGSCLQRNADRYK